MTVPLLTMAGLPALHGFTTRAGGVSTGPYASLNLGLSSGDDPATVEENRRLLLADLGADKGDVCGYHQVHGAKVMVERPGWFEEKADAGVSRDPSHLLVVSAADCFPVLLFDERTGAAGAAHCGWRGTLAHLPAEVVRTMADAYGTRPDDVVVAIGPGVSGRCYQVDADVVASFMDAGFPDSVASEGEPPPDLADLPGGPDRPFLDVHRAILFSLALAGVAAERVHSLGRCTHCEPEAFFSHRRDRGVTGRMWGLIRPGRGAGTT